MADLFEYPREDLAVKARQAQQALAEQWPAAAAPLAAFTAYVEATPAASVEELYTRTFDLNPTCSPYIGDHLFGDSCKRGVFLARLQETLRTHGVEAGVELPDHAALLFRLLGALVDDDLAGDLQSECLAPALQKMAASFGGGGDNPYRQVVEAALAITGGKSHV